MLLLNLYFLITFIQSFLLLSMARCMLGITIVSGYNLVLSVKMFNAPCHGTTIQLSVPDHVGIESSDSFASVTNAPPARSLKHVTVIQSLNPTQNTTDKV